MPHIPHSIYNYDVSIKNSKKMTKKNLNPNVILIYCKANNMVGISVVQFHKRLFLSPFPPCH